MATTTTSFDCIVIGSGPGGYVAAIRAAQLGLQTAVIEAESPGGICLNWGCIPTKALLKSAEVLTTLSHAEKFGIKSSAPTADFKAIMKRSREVVDKMTKGVSFLLKKNKITFVQGRGALEGKNSVVVTEKDGKTTRLTANKGIIIATGARAKSFPNLPIDGERIITYRDALALSECPKKLLVIGAGAIGVEFAYFFRTLGAEVTLVEMMPSILPIEDEEVSLALLKQFQKTGMDVKTSTAVETLTRSGGKVLATLVTDGQKSDGKKSEWSGDYALVAVGVQGNIEQIGLEAVGITPERGSIPVNKYMESSVPGIFAIGDVAGPPWLAHVASHEGIVAAEKLAGHNPHPVDYTNVPGCTYCQPQVASVGLTEKKAREAGINVAVGKFPFIASGKAVAVDEVDGFVKVVIDKDIEEILGVHIIHAEATELIGEATIIRSHEGTATSVFETIHAHPTLSEAIMEAMGAALGRAIHI